MSRRVKLRQLWKVREWSDTGISIAHPRMAMNARSDGDLELLHSIRSGVHPRTGENRGIFPHRHAGGIWRRTVQFCLAYAICGAEGERRCLEAL
jgi:hypothetical protein